MRKAAAGQTTYLNIATTAVFFKLKCYYTTLEHTAKAFGIEIKGQDELD